MSTKLLTIIVIIITFLIYAFIAWRNRVSSAKDFYVAGGSVPPFLNGMATAADFMSVATMLSIPGLTAFLGYDASIYLLGSCAGFFLLGVFVSPYLRKFGKLTTPDFIGDRYYSQTARRIATITVIAISLTYMMGQMRGVGVVFSRFLEVDITFGVLIGAAIVLLYSILGGMKGITYTQIAQFCILSFSFLLPIIFLSILLTDSPVHFTSWLGESTEGGMLIDKLDGLSEELGFKEFTKQGRPTIDMVAIVATLMLGTAGMPHIVVRYFTVPNVRDARRSVTYTLMLIVVMMISIAPLSVFARTYILENLHNIPYNSVPQWFKTWEDTGLITFTDLNGDGIIQHVGGTMNELKLDFDIVFLAIPEIIGSSNWLTALVASGALAAALSTASGLLLVISSAISHDLIKKQINPNITEKQEVRIARISMIGVILLAVYFGIHPPSFIIETVTLAFSISASVFFPAIVLGIFHKKINKHSAIIGMLVGLIFSLSYIIYFQFMGGKENGYWFDISAQGIGLVGMFLNLIITLLINRFFPEPPIEVQKMVENIRYPQK